MFDVDRAEHFAKGMERVLKIDSHIFRRETVAHRGGGAIARFQGTPQTIAMTSIDRDGAFRSEILLGDVAENFLFELRQTLSGRAGNAKGGYIFPIFMFGQVAFIQQHDLGAVRRTRFKIRRLRRVTIGDVQTQVCRLQRLFRARYSRALEITCLCSPACGVDQPNWNAAQIDQFLNRVARCSVGVAHNHAFITEEAVE